MLSDIFFKEKKYRKPMYFILQTMATNVVCRPDFVAYNVKSAKGNLPLYLVRNMFGAPTLAWTVKSEEEEALAYKLGFDGVIFEGYIPKDAR